MKNNWIINTIIIILFSLIFAMPLGSLYRLYAQPSGGWINIDPNSVLPGFLMALSFIVAFLAGLQRKWLLLIIVVLVFLLDIWAQAIYDLRFDLYATAIGLVLGFLARWGYTAIKKQS